MFRFECLDCEYITISTTASQIHEGDTGHIMQGVTREDITVNDGPADRTSNQHNLEDGRRLRENR